MSIRRRSAATFEGNGTFEFSEPRRFVIHNRSHRLRAGAASVPMTGTINATIVGDDYRFDHDNAFPGIRVSKAGCRAASSAARRMLSTMNGPAHARVSDVGAGRAQRAHAGLPGRRHHARRARRASMRR